MGKRIPGGEYRVLQVFEDAAMKSIGPALRGGGDVGDAAELSVVVTTADAYFRDGVEGREKLVDGAAVLHADAADAVDGVGHQCGGGAIYNQVIVVIYLDAGLGAERVNGAGGSCGAGIDSDR